MNIRPLEYFWTVLDSLGLNREDLQRSKRALKVTKQLASITDPGTLFHYLTTSAISRHAKQASPIFHFTSCDRKGFNHIASHPTFQKRCQLEFFILVSQGRIPISSISLVSDRWTSSSCKIRFKYRWAAGWFQDYTTYSM